LARLARIIWSFRESGEGSSGLFGGNSETDNSGNLLYTRVSFAGNLINDEDELNGIAFQGVGNGTVVDFIQVHNNADDGVEFFGGTVNVKHVVLTGNGDDSMDWTDGWTGKAQYVLIDQADDAGDRAIEGDNRSSNSKMQVLISIQLKPLHKPQLVMSPSILCWLSVTPRTWKRMTIAVMLQRLPPLQRAQTT